MALTNNLGILGIILIFLGIILIIASSFTQKTNVKSAGIIFMGPIPLFGWASDKTMFYILIALTVLVIILFYLLRSKF